jgi:hypothetical protein
LAVPSSRPALLDFVHLSSQRTLVPVRQDGCFAEKQEPHPALLLIVLGERVAGTVADTRIVGEQEPVIVVLEAPGPACKVAGQPLI